MFLLIQILTTHECRQDFGKIMPTRTTSKPRSPRPNMGPYTGSFIKDLTHRAVEWPETFTTVKKPSVIAQFAKLLIEARLSGCPVHACALHVTEEKFLRQSIFNQLHQAEYEKSVNSLKTCQDLPKVETILSGEDNELSIFSRASSHLGNVTLAYKIL